MALSLNQMNDQRIIEMAKEARSVGATVEMTTKESSDNLSESVRTITITYQTHSADARVLNTRKKDSNA